MKDYATESHKYINRKMFGGIRKLFFSCKLDKYAEKNDYHERQSRKILYNMFKGEKIIVISRR